MFKCPFEVPVLWAVVFDSQVHVCSENTLGFLLSEHLFHSTATACQLSVSSTVLSGAPRRQTLVSLYCQYQRQSLTHNWLLLCLANTHQALAICYHCINSIDTSGAGETHLVSAFMEPV